jgi:hypothetical protein
MSWCGWVTLIQPHRKVLAMIHAYLDESGIQDGAAICVVAGYFGGPGQWRKQEIAWRKTLAEAGVPLKKFHSLDLIEHRKFFFEMPREKHKKLINDLTAALMQPKIYPISYGVILDDFAALSMPQKQFFTGATIDDRIKPGKLKTSGCPSKPYFMPFLQCLRKLCEYAPVGGKTHFFFGLDRPFYRYALEMFKMIENRPEKPHAAQLGNAHLPPAKETPQLQAADFLCYLTYKHMLDSHEKNDWSRWPEHPLGTLLRKRRQAEDCIFYNREVMTDALETTYAHVGNWDGHATGSQR